MHDNGKNKSHASDTMPESERADRLSETEFLDRQTADARAAIGKTIDEIRAALKDTADLRAWVRAYPWPTIGVAATLGFLAASAMRRSATGGKTLVSPFMERMLQDEQISARLKELCDAEPKSKTASITASLFGSLFKVLAASAESAIVAALTARAEQAAPANGHQEAAAEQAK